MIPDKSEKKLLRVSEAISYLDLHFARLMLRLSDRKAAELFLAAALVSSQTREGHICLDLTELQDDAFLSEKFGEDMEHLKIPSPPEMVAALKSCSVVGQPGAFRPLILDEKNRLYLNRYWEYQEKLTQFIKSRVASTGRNELRPELRKRLNAYFPEETVGEINWQKIAAVTALMKKFCVITGGPGTGKTYTVAKILALLLEPFGAPDKCRITLSAPTGKAAVRLQDSIKNVIHSLDCPESVKAAIPREAATIHRVLGYKSHSPYFYHNAQNRLEVDIMIVDEASMVDLALMSKLVQALPDEAKLILLGDNNQLASVEAGAVLGDICDTGQMHHFSGEFAQTLETVNRKTLPMSNESETESGIRDCIVQLHKSYRFESQKGIGALSRAVNAGDGAGALEILTGAGFTDVEWHSLGSGNIMEKILAGFHNYTDTVDPETIFARFENFRILCAVRQGPYGVNTVNSEIERYVKRRLKIPQSEVWYATQPILITQNDYSLQLFNGDIGIILPDTEAGELLAHFRSGDGSIRKIRPFRLPEHETAYAMTVHKSQGSEFQNVLLLLPNKDARILTRELIYTAITRAIEKVEIWGDQAIFRTAVARRIRRTSGLHDALWT